MKPPPANSSSKESCFKRFKLLPRTTLVRSLLLLILLLGLIIGVILVRQRQLLEKRAVEYTATLSFSQTEFTGLSPGDSVNVNIMLNTGGQGVAAVDNAINFNSSVLELTNVDPSWALASTNFKTFAPIVSESNCSFDFNLNQANSSGRIEFGAVTFDCAANGGEGNITGPVNGVVNNLAQLNFRVSSNAAGGTYEDAISFDWESLGASRDSNVVLYQTGGDASEDILQPPSSTVRLVVSGEPATPTQPVATPTSPPPGEGELTVKFRLQGITTARPNQPFRFTIKQAGQPIWQAENVMVLADINGVFTAVIESDSFCNASGNLDFLIKSNSHLQKKFTNQHLSCGNITLDLSQNEADEMLVGDVNDSNTITVDDVAAVLVLYTYFSVPVAAYTPEDVNLDSFITIDDVALTLLNYTDFEIPGDD